MEKSDEQGNPMTKGKQTNDAASAKRRASGKVGSVKSAASSVLSQAPGKAPKKAVTQPSAIGGSTFSAAAAAATAAAAAAGLGIAMEPAVEKKGHSLQFRARPALRAKIDKAAEDAGRSLSEEIEYRLAKSFEPAPGDRAAELLFGSRMNAYHLSMFAAVLDSISELARKVSGDPKDEWWASMLGRAGAAAAFNELTTILIAPNDVVLTEEEAETVGEIKLMAIARALRLAREADRRERAQKRKEGRVDYATALDLMINGGAEASDKE